MSAATSRITIRPRDDGAAHDNDRAARDRAADDVDRPDDHHSRGAVHDITGDDLADTDDLDARTGRRSRVVVDGGDAPVEQRCGLAPVVGRAGRRRLRPRERPSARSAGPSQHTGALPATGANADYIATMVMVFVGAGVLAIVLATVRRRNERRHA